MNQKYLIPRKERLVKMLEKDFNLLKLVYRNPVLLDYFLLFAGTEVIQALREERAKPVPQINFFENLN